MQVISPGSTIGIMGGGQLGRMLCLAAGALGYRTHIFTPEENAPASEVASETTVAAYDDEAAMREFAGRVDIVTFEFENVPASSLAVLEAAVPVSPSAESLAVSQHRIREKDFVRKLGIPTAGYAPVTSAEELAAAVRRIGAPSILKTCELGYDGKGQAKILPDTDPQVAWSSLNVREAILEAFVDFTSEISVIVARGASGEIIAYEPAHNVHTNHILDTTTVPAPIAADQAEEATRIARTIAEALRLVGLLAVEMFVAKDGRILVNELAPRPHNSGHWTMDAAVTSQFEQHIRAICGWPLGDAGRHRPVVMKNLIGADVNRWQEHARNPLAKIHLYGKKDARPGRKMGHVNFLE